MKYRYTCIRKRSGGVRWIAAPSPELKARQRELMEELAAEPTGDAVHGFVRGRSAASCAAQHVGRAVVVRIDLRGFFPSVSRRRVEGLFRSLGARRGKARQLAELSTDGRSRALPQGAPTSPVLANLVARRMDRRLLALSARLGWTFTRYADDLTFSGDDGGAVDELLSSVGRVVSSEGFAINDHKTRVMHRGKRQVVTGIVVNDKPSLPREEIRRLRAILHNAERTGLAAQNREGIEHWTEHLRGKIGLLHMVAPEKAAPLVMQFERLVRR